MNVLGIVCRVFGCTMVAIAQEQILSTSDQDSVVMNTDAIYTRPFLYQTTGSVGVGGYVEAHVQSGAVADIPTGVHFQAQRFTMFLAAAPASKLRFMSELEFENGTQQINLEFASLDVVFSRSLMLRGGIVMIPIGAFNQNHDGPRWNFVDRPLSATQLLPATWSSVGFGLLGKVGVGSSTFSYEVYGTNGLNENIVSNNQRRTSLPAAKTDPLRFQESFNGKMMLSARTAIASEGLGEVGLSYAGGAYTLNTSGGLLLGPELWHHIAACDYSFGTFADALSVRAEFAYVNVQLPVGQEPSYASHQVGGYADLNYALWRGNALGFSNSAVFIGLRGEYVDFHLSQPSDAGADGDEVVSVTAALSYHPASGTILRFNYRTTWQSDVIGNEAVKSYIVQFGLTSYF